MSHTNVPVTIECSVPNSFIPTERAVRCAAMFGIDGDDDVERMLIARTDIPIVAGSVVFINGPSGGGKSTLLRAIAADARRVGHDVIDASSLAPPRDAPLVDCLNTDTLPQAMATLARAGLAEARVFLRRPRELSDGQRARFELARLMHETSKHAGSAVCIVDEFATALDRLTAHALAIQVRAWTKRSGHIAVLASAHDDVIASLQPDVLVHIGLTGDVEVLARDA